MIGPSPKPAPPPADAPSPGPRVALGPGVVLLATLASAASAGLSLYVFSVFGLVPGGGLLAATLVVSLRLVPGLRWGQATERRLLIHTATAVAAVGSAFGLTLPVATAAIVGRPDLTSLLLLGAALAGATALVSMGWWFGSPLLPAGGPWLPGQQAAAELVAEATGLARLAGLLLGLGGAQLGGALWAPPLLGAFGISLLCSSFGLGLLAVGLIVRPGLPFIFGVGLNDLLVPQALMLGAAVASLLQASALLLLPRTDPPKGSSRSVLPAAAAQFGLLTLLGLALLAGVRPDLGWSLPLLALALAGLALVSQLFAGLEAAWLGWSATLGGALVVVAVALRLGLGLEGGLVCLALSLASGPLAAELAYELKAGSELGQDRLRRQQVLAALLGLTVALLVVSAALPSYVERGFLPPPARVLALVLGWPQQPPEIATLLPWLLAGALLQWLGGAGRQCGLLLATGLLVDAQLAGWAILAGLALRAALSLSPRRLPDPVLACIGLGCIAGELLRGWLGGR